MSTQNISCGTCHPIAHQQNIEGNFNILKRAREALTTYMKSHQQRRKAYRQHRINRQAFQHMLTLDNHILKDIGIKRDDVIWANRLPLNQNASLELEKISRQNGTVI